MRSPCTESSSVATSPAPSTSIRPCRSTAPAWSGRPYPRQVDGGRSLRLGRRRVSRGATCQESRSPCPSQSSGIARGGVMIRPRNLAVLAGAAVAAVAVLRHGRRATRGHRVPGGILIGHTGVYDTLSRLLLGPLYRRIAADVAAVAPAGAQVLGGGCGPGHLSIRLARHHGLEVTGLDLDPAMVTRARANTHRPETGDQRRPVFLVGDVAALAFPDGSF